MNLLDKFKKKTVCCHCGKELDGKMTFCPYCGQKQEREKKYCAVCGTGVKEGMLFCPSCGQNFTERPAVSASAPEKNVPVAAEQPVQPVQSVQSVQAVEVAQPAQAVETQAVYEMPVAVPVVAAQPAQAEQSEQPVQAVEGQPAQPAQAENDYNVVVVASPSGPLPLVKVLRSELGLDFAMSKQLAKKLPFPLFSRLTEGEAKAKAAQLTSEGIVVQITRGDVNRQPKKNTAIEAEPSEYEKRKSKLKLATVLSTCGALVTILVALFVLLLPMFTNTYYEYVGEDRVMKEENVSVITMMIESVKSIVNIAEEDSYSYFGYLYLIIGIVVLATVGYLVYTSVKDAIGKIKSLVKFDEYSEKELNGEVETLSAQEVFKSLRKTTQGNQLVSVLIEIPFLMWIFGFDKIVWGSIVVILLFALGGIILDKIAKSIKKKAVNP